VSISVLNSSSFQLILSKHVYMVRNHGNPRIIIAMHPKASFRIERECRTPSSENSGFTLIELITVIGTIAVFAGMLLPALALSQSGSQQIGCLNNVRQLNVTFQLYAADNDGKIVANNNGTLGTPTWVEGSFGASPFATNLARLNEPLSSLFARYVSPGDVRIYQCPRDSVGLPGPVPRVRSYALNSYMGWEGPAYRANTQGNANGPYRLFKRLGQIGGETKNSKQQLSPTDAFTFQDVQPYSICWPFFGMHLDHDAWFHFPAIFHDRGSSIGFADGHAETHRWRMPSTDSAPLTRNAPSHLGTHDYGLPPTQTQDLFWLQDHTTGKK
jgi:prepilin-type processing-associated H-X9-DG protein